MVIIIKNEDNFDFHEKKIIEETVEKPSIPQHYYRNRLLFLSVLIVWCICLFFAIQHMNAQNHQLQIHLKEVSEKPLVFEGVSSKNLTVRYIETAHLTPDGTYTQDFYIKTNTPYGDYFEIVSKYVDTSELKVIDENVEISKTLSHPNVSNANSSQVKDLNKKNILN